MTKQKRPNPILQKPWGFAVAMLTASIVTLIGAIMQLDPDVILWRASLAAVVMGITTRSVIGSAGIFLTNS